MCETSGMQANGECLSLADTMRKNQRRQTAASRLNIRRHYRAYERGDSTLQEQFFQIWGPSYKFEAEVMCKIRFKLVVLHIFQLLLVRFCSTICSIRFAKTVFELNPFI